MVMGTDAGDEFHSGAGRHLPHTVIHRIASGVAWGDVGPMVRGCSPPRESGAMKLKLVLATASAMGVLMSAAWANDSNTLYLEQIGDGNLANVHQSSGGGNNDIGTAGDPITQAGNHNSFSFSNSGSGSGTNNDVIDVEQLGNNNIFSSAAWNGANNNVIDDVEQIGNANRVSVSMNGSDAGLVDDVLQQGNGNHLVIEQSGSNSSGNKVLSVSMIGDNNGLPPDANGDWRRAGTYLFQSGNSNVVAKSSITGSNNIGPAGDSNTYRNTHRIEQRGTGNTASAVTLGSLGLDPSTDYNRIWIFQTGDGNTSDVSQGLSAASFGNKAQVTQTGNDNTGNGLQSGDANTIAISEIGSHNSVTVNQTGDGNSATANITGNSNGGGMMSGGAASVAASNGLTSGLIVQDGFSNTALYTVSGSDSNQFAFLQDGNLNSITGSVSGSGGNQAAVAQTGSSNTVSFTQIGSSNNLAVSQ